MNETPEEDPDNAKINRVPAYPEFLISQYNESRSGKQFIE